MKALIDAAKLALPMIETALETRRAMGIPDNIGRLAEIYAKLQGEVAVAEAQALGVPGDRHCESCNEVMTRFGCSVEGMPFHWCPACGSIRSCDGVFTAPASRPQPAERTGS